jgi:phosphatidate phosphatase APP1
MRLIAGACGALLGLDPDRRRSEIKSDERVVFFPTTARRSDHRDRWIVRIHGWIFEPETDSRLRRVAMRRFRRLLSDELDPSMESAFDKRARWFLVDNERGKHLQVRVGEHAFALPTSKNDGHFEGTIEVPAETVAPWAQDDWLPFEAVTRDDDSRVFPGKACLIKPEGLSVISDIDDTMKVTEVSDKKRLLVNVFVRPYQPVPGMADVYRTWAEAGAKFHLVSSSPWQLYCPLSEFAREAGFPEATYHLRPFRIKGRGIFRLSDAPMKRKPRVIESLLSDFPRRQFILVGDSGQCDPEVYALVARKFPRQIQHIYIRDVTHESADSARYQRTFAQLPSTKWSVFRNAEELPIDQPGLFT